MSRHRPRPVARLSPLACPQADCGRPIALTDGRQVYLAVPGEAAPTARVTQPVTLCCGRPGCRGCVNWYPDRRRTDP